LITICGEYKDTCERIYNWKYNRDILNGINIRLVNHVVEQKLLLACWQCWSHLRYKSHKGNLQ